MQLIETNHSDTEFMKFTLGLYIVRKKKWITHWHAEGYISHRLMTLLLLLSLVNVGFPLALQRSHAIFLFT